MASPETPISLRTIRAARNLSYLCHAVERTYPTHRSVSEHEQSLPRFNDKTYLEHIEDRVAQETPTNVLEIGCGQGALLACLAYTYPGLKTYGLSAHDYSKEENYWKSEMNKVDYRVGDAHKLKSVFSDTKFDIIVSLYVFEYLADPLAVLKQAYSLCNENGMVFLDKFMMLTSSQADELGYYWQARGIKSHLKRFAPNEERFDPSMYALAIQRGSNPHLALPFAYAGYQITPVRDREPNEPSSDIRLTYSFDQAKMVAGMTALNCL